MLLNLTRVSCTPLAGLIAIVVWIHGTVALAQVSSPERPGIEAPADAGTGTGAPAPEPPRIETPADPKTGAYFVKFGDIALEFTLRAWIKDFGVRYATSIELAVAIQAALEQAGRGIPFLQRDLHLVSVSPDAASNLGAATRPSPRPGPIPGSGDRS